MFKSSAKKIQISLFNCIVQQTKYNFSAKFKALNNRILYNNTNEIALKQPSGDVYIWSSGNKPSKIELPQKARRVHLGQSHTAIVSQSGNLYTYGANTFGQLGHNNKDNLKTPKMVEYFQKKGIKVKQALCGDHHTIVLTQSGEVYTFGNGGKKPKAFWNFYNIFASKASPLGHGNQDNISKPKKISYFADKKIQRITCGSKFNFAMDTNGRVYFWGSGDYGVPGDGSTKGWNVPTTNQYFQYLQNQQKITIKKIKSCATHSLALMTNGQLYGWGSNHAGQIGIKNQIGIQLHEMVNFPHAMIREGYQQNEIVNFDSSQNMSVLQLDNGQIWWCGGHIAHKPEHAHFQQQGNVKLFAASIKSFLIVSNSNNIYMRGKFLQTNKGKQDIKTGLIKFKGEDVFKGQILGIGGEYSSKYAIIN